MLRHTATAAIKGATLLSSTGTDGVDHVPGTRYDGAPIPGVGCTPLTRSLTRNDLQEEHELESVPEVLVDVLNLRASLPKVGVAPGCEGLERQNTAGPEGQHGF